MGGKRKSRFHNVERSRSSLFTENMVGVEIVQRTLSIKYSNSHTNLPMELDAEEVYIIIYSCVVTIRK